MKYEETFLQQYHFIVLYSVFMVSGISSKTSAALAKSALDGILQRSAGTYSY